MRRFLFAAVLLGLSAAACGESPADIAVTTEPPATQPPPVTTTALTKAPPVTAPPVAPDQLVLMVRREGGLVPAEILLDRLPLYMLYADGRLVFRGPQPPSFPASVTSPGPGQHRAIGPSARS